MLKSDKDVKLRLPAQLHREVKVLAAKSGVSMVAMIRMLLRRGLDNFAAKHGT